MRGYQVHHVANGVMHKTTDPLTIEETSKLLEKLIFDDNIEIGYIILLDLLNVKFNIIAGNKLVDFILNECSFSDTSKMQFFL